jgi:hypothetical protein
VFPDVKGYSLANIISDINTAALATSLATTVATDGGGFVRITSPTTGLASVINITLGNAAIGFTTSDREEGGTELGKRVGIAAVVSSSEITLAAPLRTVSTSDDIFYTIESVEASVGWIEDDNVLISKIDDSATVFVSSLNVTKNQRQALSVATPLVNAMENSTTAGTIAFNDTSALFISNGVIAGDTVRVSSSTPSSGQGDYLVAQVLSETSLTLSGTLASSPVNAVTYEVFETMNNRSLSLGSNTDNETQIAFVSNEKNIARIELDRVGSILFDNRQLLTRPYSINFLDTFIDTSDYTHTVWSESVLSSSKPYFMKIDEFGDIVLDPILCKDALGVSQFVSMHANAENEPVIQWIDTDFSLNINSPTTNISMQKWSAQDYFIKINSPALNSSILEDNAIVFTKEFLGQPILIKYKTSEDVKTVNDFIHSAEHQIIDSNYLAKYMTRAVISLSLSYAGTVKNSQQIVIDFINNTDASRLEASDIADVLYANGATQVTLPFTMFMIYTDIDGTFNSLSSQDALEIPRTASFFADSDSIVVTNIG